MYLTNPINCVSVGRDCPCGIESILLSAEHLQELVGIAWLEKCPVHIQLVIYAINSPSLETESAT